MKNIPLPDLYYLENPDLKQLFRIMRISIFLFVLLPVQPDGRK